MDAGWGNRLSAGRMALVVTIAAAIFGAVFAALGVSTAGAAGTTLYAYANGVSASACDATSDNCSLTSALAAAVGGDTIYLETPGSGSGSGTYTGNWTINASHSLNGQSLTIEPDPSAANTSPPILSGTGFTNSILTVDGTVNLTVDGTTLENGNATSGAGAGGAILYGFNTAAGTLTANSDTFTNDHAAYDGGAIDLGESISGNATLIAQNDTFSSDTAGLDGGAIDSGDQYGTGNATLKNDSFNGDSTGNMGGAVDSGNYRGHGTLTVDTDTFTSDTTLYDGGAIDNGDNSATGTLTVTNSSFTGNTATYPGGNPDSFADGGAIDSGDDDGTGTVTVTNSSFTSNSSITAGGAIGNGDGGGTSTLTVSGSTFNANSAVEGGAIETGFDDSANGTLTVRDSTFAANSGIVGAAIYDGSTSTYRLIAIDSTFSEAGVTTGSAAPIDAAATVAVYVGGDIFQSATRCAINSNWHDAGYNAGTTANICSNTSLATNKTLNATPLGALANNGGPTQTMWPKSGNPARGLIPTTASFTPVGGSAISLCPSTDQRGVAPGGNCTSGAVDPVLALAGPANTSLSVGQSDTDTLTPTGDSGAGFSYGLASGSGPLPTGLSLNATTGAITGTPTTTGQYPVTFTATDADGDTATVSATFTVRYPGSAPSCTNSSLETAWAVASTATFDCTGTGTLTYTVASGPSDGTLSQISGNGVTYTPNAGYSGSDSFTVTATDPYGRTGTETIAVTVDPAGNVTLDTNDQLTGETAESGFSLQGGQTQTLSVNCPSGEVATDGHPWIQAVDQGTGTPADVQILEEKATSSGSYEFTLYNPLAGQAQGQLYASCISSSTSEGHQLALSSPVTQTAALSAGDTAATLSCPAGQVAVDPGYDVRGSNASDVQLIESGPSAGSSSWRFVIESATAGSAQLSISCLGDATQNGSLLSEVSTNEGVGVSGDGVPSSTTLSCPTDTVAALGGYALTDGSAFVGEQPEARSDLLWLEGQPGGGGSGTVSVMCLGLTASEVSVSAPASDPSDPGDPSNQGDSSGSGDPSGPGTVQLEVTRTVTPSGGASASAAVATTTRTPAITAASLSGDVIVAAVQLPASGSAVTLSGHAAGGHLVLSGTVTKLNAGTHTLRVKLNATGRKLLARRGKLTLTLTVTVKRPGAKTVTLDRSITVR